MGEIIDISPLLHPGIAVWPGDVPFQRNVTCAIASGANIDLSSMTTTLHVGAHTDAPSHYVADGQAMHERPLAPYLGPCQVIHVDVPRGERILPAHVTEAITAPRVLFRTDSFPNPDHFNEDFCSLSPELIAWLCDQQALCLVGIDTPSIDPCHSKALESHQAVAARDLAVLEGIVLTHVTPGAYTLVALPLRLRDGDASPVRAVLLPHDKG